MNKTKIGNTVVKSSSKNKPPEKTYLDELKEKRDKLEITYNEEEKKGNACIHKERLKNIDNEIKSLEIPTVKKIFDSSLNKNHDNIIYSISIVCFNNLHLTKKCIDSILKYSDNFELIIWNNGSTDGTYQYLESLKKVCNIKIYHCENNIGFIKPQNENVKLVSGKYIVLLNNDMEVCKGWLEILSKPFINPRMGIVGSKNTCTSISEVDYSGIIGKTLEYIEASCLMVPKSLIEKYGLFDEENFKFAYCEDADFSLKIREQGWQIETVQLNIIHHRAKTVEIVKTDIKGYIIKNKHSFYKKWELYLKNRSFNYKILVERKGAIGDVIMTTPIVHAIKKKLPLSDIYIKTVCSQVYKNNPDIKGININNIKYDVVYNLNMVYEKHPLLNAVNTFSQYSIDIDDYNYKLYTEEDIDDVILKDYKNNKIAVFHVHHSPNWNGRNFSIEKYKAGAKHLKNLGYKIVEVGTNYLKSNFNYINISFSKVCSIIKHSHIFVGQDSALFHIAQAFKIPHIIPFGMILPYTRTIDNNYTFPLVAQNVNCLGCHAWYGEIKTAPNKCLRKEVYCMKNISQEDLINMIDYVILIKNL